MSAEFSAELVERCLNALEPNSVFTPDVVKRVLRASGYAELQAALAQSAAAERERCEAIALEISAACNGCNDYAGTEAAIAIADAIASLAAAGQPQGSGE